MLKKEIFCHLSDGRKVHSYVITNCHGESVTLLDYGATIHSILVRDRDGNLGDVVLGANPDSFEESTYRGGTIGRCANRIGYGRFTVDGKSYQLEQNMMGHFLHGGSGNYAEKLFSGEMFPEENRVCFTLRDTGAGGFDTNVDAVFSFRFDDDGCLTLDLQMTPDGTTILNPTNHAYFNLSETGDARDHWVWIGADKRVSRGEAGLPDGGSLEVGGTPADFTRLRKIREAMESDSAGYFRKDKIMFDEFYLLGRRKMRHVATLKCQEKGRIMKVFTDMPCLVLFCAGGRGPEVGKNGTVYDGHCAVCLETGFVPNAVNCSNYESPVYRQGETLRAVTVYQFLAE